MFPLVLPTASNPSLPPFRLFHFFSSLAQVVSKTAGAQQSANSPGAVVADSWLLFPGPLHPLLLSSNYKNMCSSKTLTHLQPSQLLSLQFMLISSVQQAAADWKPLGETFPDTVGTEFTSCDGIRHNDSCGGGGFFPPEDKKYNGKHWLTDEIISQLKTQARSGESSMSGNKW